MKYYIDYLDCKNNYKPTRRYFKTYKKAMIFMTKTFDTVNSDLINIV
jgi:hypothetical protein